MRFLIAEKKCEWITSVEEIESLLQQIYTAVSIASEFGFVVKEVHVNGGEKDHDAGFEEFPIRHYHSYEELEERLILEFTEKEKLLNSSWDVALTIGYIKIRMENGKNILDLFFRNSRFTADFIYIRAKDIGMMNDIFEKYKEQWQEDGGMLQRTNRKTGYYQFANGEIFKYEPEALEFYSLLPDGTWEADHSLMTKFYETWSDYTSISEADVNEEMKKRQTL